ncbi:hypothetical protein FHS28_002951 [Roseateles terrae]|uniref:Uncharacterized protein n=1 Tax=Roseateles terrae TaxID=431060 RepID=A0ABR6GTU6_9BURK|nr:hypothetical protein [Roseateles terrae]
MGHTSKATARFYHQHKFNRIPNSCIYAHYRLATQAIDANFDVSREGIRRSFRVLAGVVPTPSASFAAETADVFQDLSPPLGVFPIYR